jgi:hypothetical protein
MCVNETFQAYLRAPPYPPAYMHKCNNLRRRNELSLHFILRGFTKICVYTFVQQQLMFHTRPVLHALLWTSGTQQAKSNPKLFEKSRTKHDMSKERKNMEHSQNHSKNFMLVQLVNKATMVAKLNIQYP